MAARKGRPNINRDQSTRRVQDARKQTKTYRPNEDAAPRARLDNDDTRAANDANCGEISKDAATETTADKGGSRSRRQSKNNAAELPAETTGRPKGQNAALVSGIYFPIQVVKVRQPLHRQAMLVFFAFDVHFHQMLEKPFTGTLGLGTICKSTIYDQHAING
jgi:hypothetical protein